MIDVLKIQIDFIWYLLNIQVPIGYNITISIWGMTAFAIIVAVLLKYVIFGGVKSD